LICLTSGAEKSLLAMEQIGKRSFYQTIAFDISFSAMEESG
jgi:hypothetical protein